MSTIEKSEPLISRDSREVITLTEASAEARSVTAILSFSRGGTYKIGFKAPSTELLEGLHDSFLHKGTSTLELSEMAAELFETDLRSVFSRACKGSSSPEVMEQTHQLRTDWDRALRSSVGDLELIIEGGSTIHSVPWEFVLTQPDGRLSPTVPIIRKLTGYAPPPPPDEDRPPRVLLVIARPYGPLDVSHRYIANELLASQRKQDRNVTIDVLRGGGSFERLAVRLEESDYQIVHFDMHGELLDGKGHLRFESDEVEGSDNHKLVDAKSVAELLLDSAVQLGIFTACDSARPWSGEYGVNESLAHEMARLGVPATVGMSQPISAEGARDFSRHLYEELFSEDHTSVAAAVARAKAKFRQTLTFNNSERTEEWRIPTLYLRSDPDLTVSYRPHHGPERAKHATYEQLHDRDFDHRLIDRLLFQRNEPILVRGLRHTGKQALLRDLQLWWTHANYAKLHFEVDFGKADSIDNFVDRLKNELLDPSRAESEEISSEATGGEESRYDITHVKNLDALLAATKHVAKKRAEWDDDRVEREYGAIFYLKRVDKTPPAYRELVQRILEVSQHASIHAVMSAPSAPDWLDSTGFQTFDMLWLSSQPARELFVSEVGRADDLLISACSDLPGLVKSIARNPKVRDRREMPAASHYFDEVLPTDDHLNEELSQYGLTVAHLLPFGGLKGFPLPLVERQLLRRYLHICLEYGYLDVVHAPPRLAGSSKIIHALEKLGFLTPMPDPRAWGAPKGAAREMMRIHPYLPLVARRELRSVLNVDPTQMESAEISDLQRTRMEPLTKAYSEMRLWRNREFEMLRSRRRVELWYLDRTPNTPITTEQDAEGKEVIEGGSATHHTHPKRNAVHSLMGGLFRLGRRSST